MVGKKTRAILVSCGILMCTLSVGILQPVMAYADTAIVSVNQVTAVTTNQVSFGNNHLMQLYSDGTVGTSGGNEFGQLGDGTLVSRNTVQKVPGLTDVKEVAGGFRVSMALQTDGTIKMWGNDFRDLRTNAPKTPITIGKIPNAKHIYMSPFGCYAKVAFILEEDGTVDMMSYGGNNVITMGVLTGVKKIAVGGDNNNSNWATFLMNDNTVKIWKDNNASTIPFGTSGKIVDLPGVTNVAEIYGLYGGIAYKQIDGTVKLWLQYTAGTFTEVPEAKDAKDFDLGVGTTLILKPDGTLIGKKIYGNSCEVPGSTYNTFQTLATNVATVMNTKPAVDGSTYSFGIAFKNDGTSVSLPSGVIFGFSGSVNISEMLAHEGHGPVDIASGAVSSAELSYLQSDFNTAQGLVTGLVDSLDKTALQIRLDNLKVLMDANNVKLQLATQAVTTAEQTQATADITNAQSLVSGLFNNTDKSTLQARINAIPATAAVVKAEGTNLQLDVTTATTLVTALPSSPVKTALQARLAVVQSIINATASVQTAEAQKTEAAITIARDLVKVIPAGDIQTALSVRLDILQSVVSVPTDHAAPNAPQITCTDNDVIVIAVDNGSQESGTVTKTDDFETTTLQNSLTGPWARNSAQHVSGAFSLASSNHTASTSSTESVTFTVPAGMTGTLAFKYLVKSEANYDWLTVTLNGAQIVRQSGAGAWQTFSKALTAGTYTLNFVYSKDGSADANGDTAYIDDLQVTSGGIINHLPSGVKQIEYQVNNGIWTNYTGPFTPSVGGDVLITARATDYAGNVSPLSNQTVTIKNDNLQLATQKLDSIDTSVANLSTQAKIDEASSLVAEVQVLVDTLADGDAKTALQTRIDSAITDIQLAQQIVTAVDKVVSAEGSVADLSGQDKVYSAQSSLNNAQQLVTGLADGTIKAGLQDRLDVVQQEIYVGQATLDVVDIENHDISSATYDEVINDQVNKDIVLNYVNSKLVDGAVKTDLVSRLDVVQSAIDIAMASYKTTFAENAMNQATVEAAQSAIDVLQPGDTKTALQDRLDTVKAVINAEAQVIEAQTSLTGMENTLAQSDLSSPDSALIGGLQTQLDEVVTSYNEAVTVISELPTTNVQTIVDKVADLQKKANSIKGNKDSIGQIITGLNKNANQGNGKADIRNKIANGSNINVVSAYGDQISAKIGLDDLKFIAIEKSSLSVDAQGNVKAIKNGLTKMLAYNANGVVEIYFVVYGNGK